MVDATSTRDLRRVWLIVGGIVATGVALLVVIWLSISGIVQAERDAAMHHAATEAANLDAAFQEELSHTLSSDAAAMTMVAERMRASQGRFDIHRWARNIPRLSEATVQAVIIGPDGKLMSSTLDPNPDPVDLSDREHFRIHRDGHFKGIFISKPLMGRVLKQTTIKMSQRVEGDDGQFLGVVVFSLLPGQLTSLHKSVDLGDHGLMAVVGTDDGVIRARFSTADPGGVLGSGAVVPLDRLNHKEPKTFMTHSVVDDSTRIYASRPIPGFDLDAIVALDRDEVLAPARAHATRIVLVGVVVSLLLAGLIAVLSREVYRRSMRELDLARELHRRAAMEAELRSSEARFRDFANLASDWFWEQDAELRFVWLSDTWSVVGGGPAEYVGKKRWEFPSARATSDEAWAEHRAVLEARQPFRDFCYALALEDGRRLHVTVSGNPMFDADGKFLGYRGTGRDRSHEVAAEAELVAAKERAEQAETLLRDAVESISEGFVIYDRDDKLVMCNEAYRRLYPQSAPMMEPGVTFEELVQNSLAQGHYPEAVGREQAWAAEFVRAHREADSELEQKLSDGTWILASERRMRSGGLAGLRMNITALKQAQLALRESETRLDRAQEIAGIASWELDIGSGEYAWSRQMYRITGIEPTVAPPRRGAQVRFIHHDDRAAVVQWLDDLERGIPRGAMDLAIVRPDDQVRLCNVEARIVADEQGRVRRLIGTMQDVTERRLTEQKLVRAQKMELIGQLSGGMAHDFNNVLGVIIGNLDLLGRLTKTDPMAEELRGEAAHAALRGADLTRRLLAFARRQPLKPETTSVNELIDGLAKLLRRMLGEHVALSLHLGAELWPVVVDPAQLEATLTNLATNARDAMPKGGSLDIVTRNVSIDASYAAQHAEVTQGDYVLIEVSDTGTGIPRELLGQIFEPFFTTKETGKGSGLGLSMVYGFIRQSGGSVSVYSEPELGTTFRVYLPREAKTGIAPKERISSSDVGGGSETILVVEDNAQLRRATVEGLKLLGYRVLEAEDGDAALSVLETDSDVRLLFTDVVMPGGVDGTELAERAMHMRPELRLLLTSGFPDVRGSNKGKPLADYNLLNKPYRHDELARAVRAVLDTCMIESAEMDA
jgi:PAS domain S-box-containing protein